MKTSEVREKILANETVVIEIMRNPGELSEWVVWIRENDGKSFLLLNEFDVAIATNDANQVLLLLRTLGVKHATIAL